MSQSTRRIGPPTGHRSPLKVNIFEFAKSGTSQLLPLFPYVGPGAIVPASGVQSGKEDPSTGRFFHENSIDEVGLCFGAVGTSDGAAAGSLWTTGRTHPVGRVDDDPEPPVDSAAVITVTQRHRAEEQRESFAIRCEACQHLLLRHRFSFVPTDPEDGELETFTTLVECANGAEEFNASEELRACSKCGHVNPVFPVDLWGWRRYRIQAEAAEAARRSLLDAARDLAGVEA